GRERSMMAQAVSDTITESPAWLLGSDAGRRADHAELGSLFAFGAAMHADKIAVDDGRASHSFDELDAMSQRLAAAFAARGVGSGDRVAVIADKRAIMPAIAVAIWACGAVYVPLDGEAPPARIDGILKRLRPRLVVSCRDDVLPEGHPAMSREAMEAVALDEGGPRHAQAAPMDSDASAYILFTSGSTGEPKGVEITVGSLLAYFKAHNEVLRFEPQSRVISFTPYHFDVSIEDTLLPLSLGAFVYQYRGIVAGPLIRKILTRERITHMIAVSTILTLISNPADAITHEAFPDMSMVMTGAEVCDPKIINLWKDKLADCRVINAYGPTETTIVCLCHTIDRPEPDRSSSFPIGRALDGVHVAILREDGEEAGDGEQGELCIGGAQVMRGYFDQPDENARVLFERDGVRYYRTGDICFRQEDGSIVFVGRSDDEVKISGKRIHLGEIRQKVMSLQNVDRVAIGTAERKGRREIVIIVVSADEGIVARAQSHLAEQLPAYMRPAIWGHATSVTLSTTGKTDEKKLLAQVSALAADSRESVFRIAGDGAIVPRKEAAHG
ncbi:MAG TPA: amino acid adenylation domain-containing protein, partial [Saliniramus sp.]|nr:amino acid adenylation domain-containing protein [Saliniramus sp.]